MRLGVGLRPLPLPPLPAPLPFPLHAQLPAPEYGEAVGKMAGVASRASAPDLKLPWLKRENNQLGAIL